MGLFSRQINTLEDLFAHGLKDIYYAENQILKALPELIENTTNPQLKKALKIHLKETQEQVKRLEQIFQLREEKPKGTRCPGINGLISEGEDLTGEIGEKDVLDAAIISAAQAVEHYEITRYGALIAWAEEMGRGDFAAILQENLNEEKATDKKLTSIAEGRINRKAGGNSAPRTGNRKSARRGRAAARRKAA
jgi:ferritin-like metal-binding protein YciE